VRIALAFLLACGGFAPHNPRDYDTAEQEALVLCQAAPTVLESCSQIAWEFGGNAICLEVSGCDFYAEWCPNAILGDPGCKPVRITCVEVCP